MKKLTVLMLIACNLWANSLPIACKKPIEACKAYIKACETAQEADRKHISDLEGYSKALEKKLNSEASSPILPWWGWGLVGGMVGSLIYSRIISH